MGVAAIKITDVNTEDSRRSRIMAILFAFCMFATGGSGLVNQYVLATMTTNILGNSIEQFSIVIAVMMLMMGVSGWVQEYLTDKGLVEKFMTVEVMMAILGGFAPVAIYAAFGFMGDNFIFVHYAFIVSIGFLIGFEIPIVMRIIEQQGIGLKVNLKVVYSMDYIGAFVLAIVWVKFLLAKFPLTEISFIVSGANFAVAAMTIAYFQYAKIIPHSKTVIAVLVATAAALGYGYCQNRDWSSLMEQKFYEDPIVDVQTSKYQHLVLTQNPRNHDVRLYINGNTQFSSLDEERYHDFLVHPAFAVRPYAQRVLVLGGGDGLAMREILKYEQVQSVDLVDLDPAMVEWARSNPLMSALNKNSLSDARVFRHESEGVVKMGVKGVYVPTGKLDEDRLPETEWVASVDVYHVDADRFVSESHDKPWDIIIIDFPDPSSIELSKLYSREFFRKLKHHMTDETIVTMQSTSPYHAKEAYLAIKRTMEAAGLKVIPYRQNIPSFGDWGWMMAWKGSQSVKEVEFRLHDVGQFQVETPFITPQLMTASLSFGKGELESKNDCVNSIMYACLLDLYTNHSWQQY